MIVHPSAQTVMVVESDHAAYSEHTKERKRNDMADVGYLVLSC